MAKVKSFNGIRYDAFDVSKLICPPYDIISKKEKGRLKGLSPNNMVRLELPDEEKGLNKYANSARLLKEWLSKRVLLKDSGPSLYFYEQSFTDHGRKLIRRGFFAALRLENIQGGSVKPHEKTLAKPKEDRLKLLRAAKTNLSPIFGLFNDKGGRVLNISRSLSREQCDSFARDAEGTLHKLWVVNDKKTVDAVCGGLKKLKIFIADGHHRYETAWNYSQIMKEKGKKLSMGKSASSAGMEYNFVMIYLCSMEDPGLSIWPTHRVVVEPGEFESRIERYFRVLPGGAFKKYSGRSPQPLLVWKNGKKRTLVLKSARTLDKAMPGRCKAYRELGVSMLHSLLLQDVSPEKITYVKSENEALKLARARKCLAVIVPSTPIEAVKEIALAGQTMPQKSTYFYPKVASGMVLHSLK